MASPKGIVLSRADWERIVSEKTADKGQVYTRQEVVDHNYKNENGKILRPLTSLFAEVREVKKYKERENEENLNKLAAEEIENKRQDRQQTIDRYNRKKFLENDSIRKFNTVVLRTQMDKQNEALMDTQRRKQLTALEDWKAFEEEIKRQQEEFLRQEQDKARQRKLSNIAVQAHQLEEMRLKREHRERERQQEKDERERQQALEELYLEEKRRNALKRVESKKNFLMETQRDIADKNQHKETETEKEFSEDMDRSRDQGTLEERMLQRKNERVEMMRKQQIPRDIVREQLEAMIKEQTTNCTLKEGDSLKKWIERKEEALAKQERDEMMKKAAMRQSIFDYRECVMQERELQKKEEIRTNQEWLQAQKDCDKLYNEQQRIKRQKAREAKIEMNNVNNSMMNDSKNNIQQMKMEEKDFDAKKVEEMTEWEKQLQQYFHHELHKALGYQRPLLVAKKHIMDPLHLCQTTDASLPRYATNQTRAMKQYLERNKLQLTYLEESEQEPKTVPISANDTPAGHRYAPPGTEGCNYLSQAGQPLCTFSTDKARSTRQTMEFNNLQLFPKANHRAAQLPPISTEGTPA